MKTLYFDPDQKARWGIVEDFRALGFTGGASTKEFVAMLRRRYHDEYFVSRGGTFSAEYLTDEDGVVYTGVEFQVLSAVTIDRKRWGTGVEFRVNLTDFVDTLEKVLEEGFADSGEAASE